MWAGFISGGLSPVVCGLLLFVVCLLLFVYVCVCKATINAGSTSAISTISGVSFLNGVCCVLCMFFSLLFVCFNGDCCFVCFCLFVCVFWRCVCWCFKMPLRVNTQVRCRV